MRHMAQLIVRIVDAPRCVAIAVMMIAPAAAGAEENPYVESGGEALRDRVQIPWYNAEQDGLQPVQLINRWNWDLSLIGRPLLALVVTLVVVLLAILIWMVVRSWLERERKRASGVAAADPLVTADRIEALPFLRQRDQSDLLGQARRYYEQGNYGEAIIYLFSHELVELDRASLIRLAQGKTNRQYLREAGNHGPVKSILEHTMVTFEGVFFGRQPLDRAGFESCWRQLAEFDGLLAQLQVPA
jgi:hypothetical protein